MKLMRLAICVAVFAVIGGIAISEDLDVRALQAKLAAQEARLNDLQAKMNSKGGSADAEGVVSLRKNAVVTIGGTVNTRYFYRSGETKSALTMDADNVITGVNARRDKREEMKYGDLRISDAKLEFKVDVNDYFDAYVKLDLHDGAGRDRVSGVAQNYWIRWKNVCNSGFGLLVGRDALKFGDSQPIGILDSWNKDQGGSWNDAMGNSIFSSTKLAAPFGGTRGEGMFGGNGSAQPAHTTWNWTRTTQITPYWESQDGKFKAEVSFIQSIDRRNGTHGVQNDGGPAAVGGIGERKYRSINYGIGSMTARLTWKPIDGLKLTASALNYYANNYNGMNFAYAGPTDNSAGYGNHINMKRNNTAVNFGFQYRPCFFNRLNVWAQWTHGWNEAWVDNQDSDSINFGFMVDLTEKLTFFAMGDYLRVKNDQALVWHKANGWAAYTGLKYKIGYGVAAEIGWRHEQMKYKGRNGGAWGNYSGTHTKQKADTIYGHLGFDF